MRRRVPTLVLLTCVLTVCALAATALIAQGDAKSDRELKKAEDHGKSLWSKRWKKGAKSCVTCHGRGPNKLTGKRLKTYPKYDKTARKVITAQQKLNQMIQKKSGGEELDLGSEDLNSLEAFISTLE